MEARGRPKKQRLVKISPKVWQFSPRGRPGRPDEVILTLDEFEALRLADGQGLSQKEAGKSLQVSQQTFSRILKKARQKISDTLINAKTLRIS